MTAIIIPRSALVLALAFCLASPAHSTLWVSPSGDDRNPGTEEEPLRTLGAARDHLRTLNQNMSDDLTVFIGGACHSAQPLELGPEDSGTNGFNIIYTSAPGEHPVISGGLPVSAWTMADAARNLWSAAAPPGLQEARGFYVNGNPALLTLGRLLQLSSPAPVGAPMGGPDPKAQWKNPRDVSFESAERTAIWSERTGAAPVFVRNAFELLAHPGEWYFDRSARRFYYIPRTGEQMETAEVVAVESEGLVLGNGTPDQPIGGIIFKGIRFEYTAPSPKNSGPTGTDPGPLAGAAFRFVHPREIQFAEDEFVHLGAAGLEFGPGTDGITIDGCTFADIGSDAVGITDGDRCRISDSRFSYVAVGPGISAVIRLDRPVEVSIENNQVDHFPFAAVTASAGKTDGVHLAGNRVSLPMLRNFSSLRDVLAASRAPAGAGLPAAYASLLERQVSSPILPEAPSQVSAEPEDESAYVTWIPSFRDGGAPVTTYTVLSSGGAKVTISADDFQTKGYVLFPNLANGQRVRFTVSATTHLGAGPPSLPTANIIPFRKRKLRRPGAPAEVSATSGSEGLSVRIAPPAVDGGSPIVAYQITFLPSGTQIVLEGLDVIHATASAPVVRTFPGTERTPMSSVSVLATNIEGDSKAALIRLPP